MKIISELSTKSERREQKRRPRMKKSGYSLRKPSRFAGRKLSGIKPKK